jgi:hypothetical protein
MSRSPRPDPKKLRTFVLSAALGASLGVAGCAGGGAHTPALPNFNREPAGDPTQQPYPAPPAPMDGDDEAAASRGPAKEEPRASSQAAPPREPSARPGLGTSWGETRGSRITTTPFQRADASTPFVTASMFYNDSEGARAMAGGSPMLPQRRIDVGDGVVSMGLKDGDSGRFLTGFESAGRDYVVGEAGQRYVIVIQNNSSLRLEVVVSVDGLDVIDGKPAGFAKRGYLVDGGGTLEVDGFRQSEDAVAAFRFGSVRDSYAANNKKGDARNVGVIGVALFHERGSTPALWRDEVRRRKDADPFPGRFATPPGG